MSQNQPATDSPSPAAWGFVLQHAQVIHRAARRLWTDRRVDVDDFHHDLVVDIARNHHKYDPNRSQPNTWIYLRGRAVKDHALRALSCRGDRQHGTVPVMVLDDETGSMVDPVSEVWGSPDEIVVRVELAQVLALATPKMAEAAASHLEGWSCEDVRAAFGCTMTARNNRLRRLGLRALNQ